jgi:hypothetical protein
MPWLSSTRCKGRRGLCMPLLRAVSVTMMIVPGALPRCLPGMVAPYCTVLNRLMLQAAVTRAYWTRPRKELGRTGTLTAADCTFISVHMFHTAPPSLCSNLRNLKVTSIRCRNERSPASQSGEDSSRTFDIIISHHLTPAHLTSIAPRLSQLFATSLRSVPIAATSCRPNRSCNERPRRQAPRR